MQSDLWKFVGDFGHAISRDLQLVHSAPILPEPIPIDAPNELFRRVLRCHGAVVLDCLGSGIDFDVQTSFRRIEEKFGLGEPIIPVQYSEEQQRQLYVGGINLIRQKSLSSHCNFHSCDAQVVHTDGTLDPIGEINTSVLFCETPATIGGENQIYNVLGVIHKLFNIDSELAFSMFSREALIKFSPEEPKRRHVGPAFEIVRDYGVLTRYSDSALYCRWSSAPDIQRAVAYMRHELRPREDGGQYRSEILLKRGQALVLSNSKVAHGRSRFWDDNCAKRTMWRGLYHQFLG